MLERFTKSRKQNDLSVPVRIPDKCKRDICLKRVVLIQRYCRNWLLRFEICLRFTRIQMKSASIFSESRLKRWMVGFGRPV